MKATPITCRDRTWGPRAQKAVHHPKVHTNLHSTVSPIQGRSGSMLAAVFRALRPIEGSARPSILCIAHCAIPAQSDSGGLRRQDYGDTITRLLPAIVASA